MKKKAIVVYLDEHELADFQYVQKVLERKINCDTIRAMISFCKKNFSKTMTDSHAIRRNK